MLMKSKIFPNLKHMRNMHENMRNKVRRIHHTRKFILILPNLELHPVHIPVEFFLRLSTNTISSLSPI